METIRLTLTLPTDLQEAGRSAVKDAREFPWTWIGNPNIDDKKRLIDRRLATLFEDLQRGQYWHVFGLLDGYSPERAFHEQTAENIAERRAWARENFKANELQHILDICTNFAVAAPAATAVHSGHYYGYSTLVETIVEKPGSIFQSAINPKNKNALYNGCFWEQLPSVHFGETYRLAATHVDDILSSHPRILDPNFAPRGLQIFKRNAQERTGLFSYPDLGVLPDGTILDFVAFTEELDKHRKEINVTPGDIALLVAPWARYIAEEAIKIDDDTGTPTRKKGWGKMMLKDTPVSKYLDSAPVRKLVAETIGSIIFGKGPEQTLAVDFLSFLPNPKGIVDLVLNNPQRRYCEQPDIHKLSKALVSSGKDPLDFFPPRAIQLLTMEPRNI